jgi:hypothetical protein
MTAQPFVRVFLKAVAISVSVALYALSLRHPALLFSDHPPLTGFSVLAAGWCGALSLDFAWYANPAWLTAIICLLLGKVRVARIFSGASILLGLLSFTTKEWWFNEGSPTAILSLGLAFYIWMSSLTILFLGCLLSRHEVVAVEFPR